jgi:hypothetical protein
MPYLLLFIGCALALFGLYRFLIRADARQVKTLFLSIAALGVGLGALFLAVTGKLPAAIGILGALWPIAIGLLNNRPPGESAPPPSTSILSEKEAYDILGLPPGAGADDIKAAHLRLMKKIHPDQAGSDWIAKKINAARDFLLDKRR